MSETKTCFLRILTPVHIGCDEVYEPLSFVIDEKKKEIVYFDPIDFLKTLSPTERDKFVSICKKGTISSLLELLKFMYGKEAKGERVKLCSGFLEHYRENLRNGVKSEKEIQQEMNRFSIARTSFHPYTNEPYIPGSGLKGSLRTAYLNAVAKLEKVEDTGNQAIELEKRLLHYTSFEEDPFRLLKVSDFVPVKVSRKIVYAVNERKNPASKGRPPSIPQLVEVILPGSIFMGTITIEDKYIYETGIKKPLNWDSVFKSAEFYKKEWERERDELKGIGIHPEITGVDGKGVLVRLGRHSGAECVTIECYRSISIRGKRGSSISDKPTTPTTIWLASETRKNWDRKSLQPFGWACLGIADDKMVREYSSTVKEKWEKFLLTKKMSTVPDSKVDAGEEKKSNEVAKIDVTEEVWENCTVKFDAGGGGVLRATGPKGERAQLVGKEKGQAVTEGSLHKKLFERRDAISKIKVTVRKIGNAYEITKVEP